MSFSSDLIDWFWKFGITRTPPYELDSSGWLDRLYSASRVIGTVSRSRDAARPSMALWGTSQTGKSTLLSSYLDRRGDPEGRLSALTWDESIPVRFCRENPNVKPPTPTVELNPYNHDSDASSCISRFWLTSEVPDPRHPIEVRFANASQIMHALAMGYLSECSLRRGSRGEIAAQAFDRESLVQTIDRVIESLPSGKGGWSAQSRDAYERIHQLADLVDALILSGVNRYEALEPRDGVPIARPLILKSIRTIADVDAVDKLAYEILWDSRPVITETYDQLKSWVAGRKLAWGDRPVFVSAEVASLILDAAVYSRLHSPSSDTREENRRRVLSVRQEIRPDRVNLGLDAGEPLFATADEFGSMQACVMELIIPVRADSVRDRTAFHAFLSEADLLDFPGTGREHDNVQTRMDLESIPENSKYQLLTRVLKRGKTASIVSAYSRDLTIDGFSIFSKVKDKPGQPQQLATGIRTWWGYFGANPGKFDQVSKRSPLPLNLVLSFWGSFFRMTSVEDVRSRGIAEIFENLRPLDFLGDPETVTATLAVTYEHLRGCELPDRNSHFDEFVATVKQKKEFIRYFNSGEQVASFDAMTRDGGSDYLFEVLLRQARTSPRSHKLSQLISDAEASTRRLAEDALPGDTDGVRFRRAVERWVQRIESELNKDPDQVKHLSHNLRRFMNCPPEVLDPVPLRASESNELAKYVSQQINNWAEQARELASASPHDFGFADERNANDAIIAITDAADKTAIQLWIRDYFGHLRNKSAALSARSQLSQKQATVLWPLHAEKGHRNHFEIYVELGRYDDFGGPASAALTSSPHYAQFLKPFLEYLHRLTQSLVAHERPEQPGDRELREILDRSANATKTGSST